MKQIFLTIALALLCIVAQSQQLRLHNLYWSKGSLGLENDQTKEGLTVYYPGVDVVFFKSADTHKIKTYHISSIAWLSYYDNGMRQQREFVKVKQERLKQSKLFELIPVGKFYILRLPHKENVQWEEVSRQLMDKNHQNNRYTYEIAYQTLNNDIRILPEGQKKQLSRYIQLYDLDCYDAADQEQIKKFYRQQMNPPLTALSSE